jgi:ubiquinone biosynthesis protein COQ9
VFALRWRIAGAAQAPSIFAGRMDQSSIVIDSDRALRLRVIDAALRLADRGGGWDAVRVHAVAREAGATLAEVQRLFCDRDAIAEGFFDLADEALLALPEQPGWAARPARVRLCQAILAWLDALAPHRRLARGMLAYKLQPEHLHLQARGIMRISRTVQAIREVALLPATGWQRELEEAALTSIYLATFTCWLADATPRSQRTRRLLETLLSMAARGAGWLRLDRA